MRRLGTWAVSISLVSLVGFGALQGVTTPEKSLTEFVALVVAGNLEKAATYVVGGKLDPSMAPFGEQIRKQGLAMKLSDMHVIRNGSSAQVSLKATMSGGTQKPHTEAETVSMRLVNGRWLVVPPAPGNTEAMRKPVAGMAQMLTQGMRPIFEDAKLRAQGTASLSNIKQLALATIMYSTDYDDVIPPSVANWHKAIFPYCKNEGIFKAPGTKDAGDSYALNSFVAGKNFNKLKYPAETVLLYQGKGQKLAFVHQGRAAIAFCDGHCKLMNATDAAKLRWKP